MTVVAGQSIKKVSSYGYLWRDLDNAANQVRIIVVMKVSSPTRPRRSVGVSDENHNRRKASHDGQRLIPTRLCEH
jgi:hypothetical protein